MKKFLFILFFPITVPVYLLIKLFEWIKDTFIPFVQYDVIPFVDKHIVSKIREYIDYKVEQMQEEKCAENRASNSIESGSKIKTDYLQTTANENCDVADILQEEHSPVYNDNTLISDQETIPITISVSTTVQAYSNSLVGHPPPFTPEEYKKIRYAESLEQSITLKNVLQVICIKIIILVAIFSIFGVQDIDCLQSTASNTASKYIQAHLFIAYWATYTKKIIDFKMHKQCIKCTSTKCQNIPPDMFLWRVAY